MQSKGRAKFKSTIFVIARSASDAAIQEVMDRHVVPPRDDEVRYIYKSRLPKCSMSSLKLTQESIDGDGERAAVYLTFICSISF